MGLSQGQVAHQLGVDECTVRNWEVNRTAPALWAVPRIHQFLGYVPDNPPPRTLGEKIVAERQFLGLSQEALAKRLGLSPRTLSAWETGEHMPTGKSLEIIQSFLGRIETTTDGGQEGRRDGPGSIQP